MYFDPVIYVKIIPDRYETETLCATALCPGQNVPFVFEYF